jgi:hypothetical protein
MISFTDITGLASVVLLMATAVSAVIVCLPCSVLWQRIAVGITITVTLLPMGGLSLAGAVRGITGDLSISTLLLLALTLRDRLMVTANASKPVSETHNFLMWVVLAAMLLYPSALGLSYVDTYRWGFGNMYFLAALACVFVIAYRWEMGLVMWSAILSVAAWVVGWYESTNIWDYLIDPWLSIYAIAVLIMRMIKLYQKLFRIEVPTAQ